MEDSVKKTREQILSEIFERVVLNSTKLTEEELSEMYDFIEEKVSECEVIFLFNVIEKYKTLQFKNKGK